MNPISNEIKEQIIDLYFNKSLKMTEIEEKLNISRPVISDVINKYKKEKNIDMKLSKVNITRPDHNSRYAINIPKNFLEDIDLTDEDLKKDKNIQIIVDKKEKEMKIKKINRKI